MIPQILASLLQALGPAVLKMAQDFLDANGRLPTEAEFNQQLSDEADRIIAKGEDWLAKHKE